MKREIVPTGVEAELDKRNGEILRIAFLTEDEEPTLVFFERRQVPSFLKVVAEAARMDPTARLNPNELQVAGAIGLIGWRVDKDADGDIVLTVEVTTDDGAKLLPLSMSQNAAADLVAALQSKAAS